MHIIFAAAYLAWKSLKPSERTKLNLTKFCDLMAIDYKHTTSARVTEFFNALSKLGQKIPGKEKFRFTSQNIALYLEDILNYGHSLIYDLSTEASKRFRAMSNNDSAADSVYIRQTRSSAKRKYLVKSDAQKTCDDEISESEINSYLRTDEEVKKLKKLKKFVEYDQNYDEEDTEKDLEKLKKYIKIDKLFKF